ncbi:MAG: sulfatase-like hydrolase/transferase [Sandaracinus sp.]|nr:sulfatase-like hydrolase/transferase [Sandaracinus sp.]
MIVLLVDTLRADALRVYDPRSRVETPTMDRIAREGVVFENAQSPENWTKPAVASILTSLFPATHGAKNDASRLPHSALTLGEVFQRHGFHTGSFIANGYVSRAFGFDQGWNHYTNYIREQRNTNASNVFGEAAAWIESELEADPQRRLFTYVHTIDPHVPYDPPDDHLRRYDARTDYDGQVTNRRTHLLLEDAKRKPAARRLHRERQGAAARALRRRGQLPRRALRAFPAPPRAPRHSRRHDLRRHRGPRRGVRGPRELGSRSFDLSGADRGAADGALARRGDRGTTGA